ncbi:ChaN family lipoprotein [Cyclobacterium plantarum]|uniref:ChaN family lipoprotein n=1 Tax=Cyclobacterium plantarum TaxID=2716263 RepID=A0ABX0H2X9_9BACT|nr:ChaN family lipoprotein [Cyclobacterium plantarum]NHE56159.1 ChaN family lipoprotein [Cyclobacterium plantarum]
MKKSIIILLTFIFPSLSFAQEDNNYPWKIIETSSGETTDIPAVLKAINEVQLLVFGEEHNDSIAHVVQEKLYRGMIEKYGDATLSLEMFERDVQLIMDEYLSGLISEDKLIEEGRAWSNYPDYAPLLYLAKEEGQAVLASNVPGRYANMVSRKGLGTLELLDRKAADYYSTFSLPKEDDPYLKKFNDAMGGHGQHMGPQYFHAQLLRDATMATSILQSWRKNRRIKILHLTGRFHSDEGLGTVNELKQRKKNLSIMTISSYPSQDFQNPDFKAIKPLADYIILTKPQEK